MIDLLVTLTMAFLPACGPDTHDVFGCTQHEGNVTRSNFQVADTGHYVRVEPGQKTVHITYPIR